MHNNSLCLVKRHLINRYRWAGGNPKASDPLSVLLLGGNYRYPAIYMMLRQWPPFRMAPTGWINHGQLRTELSVNSYWDIASGETIQLTNIRTPDAGGAADRQNQRHYHWQSAGTMAEK